MTMADIKVLHIRVGAMVSVVCGSPDHVIHLKVCLAKKGSVGSGTVVIHYVWKQFVSINQVKTVIVTTEYVTRLRVITDESLSLHTLNKTDPSKVYQTREFEQYVKSALNNTFVCPGHIIGITLRGEAIHMQVVNEKRALSEDDQTIYCFMITMDSEIKINYSSGITSTRTSKSNVMDISYPKLQIRVRDMLGGYEQQKMEALQVASFALNLIPNFPPKRTEPIVNEYATYTNFLNSSIFKPPRGLLIWGPSGTGKTKFVLNLVKTLNCHYQELSSSILLSNYVGEAERSLNNIFNEAKLHPRSCIIIDRMDLLCRKRSSTLGNDTQKRIVSCLLSLLDGIQSETVNPTKDHYLFIIGTSNKPDDIDPALRRPGRIDKEIEFGVPSSHDRFEILLFILREFDVEICQRFEMETKDSLSDDNDTMKIMALKEDVEMVAKLAHGMVGSDLVQVVKETCHLSLLQYNTSNGQGIVYQGIDLMMNNLSLTKSDSSGMAIRTKTTTTAVLMLQSGQWRLALKRTSPSALREIVIEVPSVRWDDIGGMDYVKNSLKEVVEWPLQHPQIFSALGISPPKGILLYGPPGCSKTLMAKALATESSMNFLTVRGPELMSKWLGESEKAIQNLFRKARAAAPSIIFFDEIDALAGKRGNSSNGVNDRVLSQLLTEMDGIQGRQQVVVIAATNRPDLLDPALIRPGRIDRKIYVSPPDDLARTQIVEIELKKMPKDDTINVSEIVIKSKGFSGAEMVSLCSDAAMIAIEDQKDFLSQNYLLRIVESMKPQITKEMIEFYEKFQRENLY